MPYETGIGFTRVFAGDLDANGRRDLLVAALFPTNGRCIEGGWVTALLFDATGRPVPWGARTHGVLLDKEYPFVLLDENGNGRAELAVHDCAYSEPPRFGEDRWIEGVFEPQDAVWKRIEPGALAPYLARAQSLYSGQAPDFSRWIDLPERTVRQDFHGGWEDGRRVEIRGRLLARFGCKKEPGASAYMPCDSRRPLGMRYGDGRIRAVVPTVVLDSVAGREVYVEPRGPVLDRLLATGGFLRVTGPEAQPAMLWAEAATFPEDSSLSVRVSELGLVRSPVEVFSQEEWLAYKQAKTPTLSNRSDQRPANGGYASFLLGTKSSGEFTASSLSGGLSQLVFSREGRCFRVGESNGSILRVVALDDCQLLGTLADEAASGARITRDGFDLSPTFFRPGELKLYRLKSPSDEDPSAVPLDPPNGLSASPVVALEAHGIGPVSQWEAGGSTWIVVHRLGAAAAEISVEGELLRADSGEGLVLLRWDGGYPVERIELAVELEAVRRD